MTNFEHSSPPDPQTVREVLEYFGTYLAFRRRFTRVPGVQAAVHIGGELAFSQAYGLADVARDIPLGTTHLFRIASHSKTFTATAVLQLAEEGRLRLDDRADSWVPALASKPIGALTLRELLAHAGGVSRDSTDGDFWQLERPFPDAAGLAAVLSGDAVTVLAANEQFKYSNIGYALLGTVIEAVTGSSYHDHVRATIVDRLGLADTGPEFDPAIADRYAAGYSALSYADTRVLIEHVDTGALAAAAGFYATAADLVTYFSAHYLGDQRLLPDSAKRVMQHPIWEASGPEKRYGLGLSIVACGDRQLIGHGGGYPGHVTRSLVDSTQGIAVSVFTNAIDGAAESMATALFTLLDRAGPARPEPAGADLTSFTGRFANLWGVFDVALLGGRLHLLWPTAADPTTEAAELEVVDDSTLRVVGGSGYGSPGETITYQRDAGGRITRIRAGAMSSVPLDDFELADPVRSTG